MSSSKKIKRDEYSKMLAVARGDQKADCVIKNVQRPDFINGGIERCDIAIAGRFIAGVGPDYEGEKVIDGSQLWAVPGFIDAHMHLESSMMNPFEFEKTTLPLGTTAMIADPHEIANVLGEEGVSWFLRCAQMMSQHFLVQIPSCVPALPGFESNGANFGITEMNRLKESANSLGMGEMMNFPGVIAGDEKVLDKIESFAGRVIDGHAPMLRGKGLNAYLCGGPSTCHETVSSDEAREKLQRGMAVIMREGTVAKNLKDLASAINESSVVHSFLCTDDRNPLEIMKEGHINYLIKMLIQECNVPAHLAYKMASFSPARFYHLDHMGLIAPGYFADIVLLSDYEKVEIADVMIGGQFVSQLNLDTQVCQKIKDSKAPRHNSMKREFLSLDEFKIDFEDGNYKSIGIIAGQIVTLKKNCHIQNGQLPKEQCYLAVVERHGKTKKISQAFVEGLEISKGALASSVAHDSHNIIVAGKSFDDMTIAVNALISKGGGFAVAKDGKIVAHLELPIAGLISEQSADEIDKGLQELDQAYKSLGGTLESPFLQLAFLALPVIPHLKLTDKGLFDVDSFQFIELGES